MRGNPTEFPPDILAINVPDGVVVDRTFAERTEPSAEVNPAHRFGCRGAGARIASLIVWHGFLHGGRST